LDSGKEVKIKKFIEFTDEEIDLFNLGMDNKYFCALDVNDDVSDEEIVEIKKDLLSWYINKVRIQSTGFIQ
jgi:hypothetical protein